MTASGCCVRVLAVLLVLAGSSLLPELVLCVGDGGHRALELVGRSCCHSRFGGESDCAGPADHCSSKCDDVKLAADAMPSKPADQGPGGDGGAATAPFALSRIPSWFERMPVRGRGSVLHVRAPREALTTVQIC